MRAVRVDKLTYAVLEATLALWSEAPSRDQLPVYRMLTMTVDDIDRRARALVERLSVSPAIRAAVIDGASAAGGGSAPGHTIPTRLVAMAVRDESATALLARLRRLDPPVIARIADDRVVLDLRTVQPDEDAPLAAALARM